MVFSAIAWHHGRMTWLPPGLNWLERLAVLVLTRSFRTTLVIVKPTSGHQVFLAANTDDPIVADILERLEPDEPPSMMLERLYHAPSHGEEE